jgi:putative oxidoreductase
MQSLSWFLMLLGRICIATIFVLSGVNKFMDYHSAAIYMASKGLTMIPFFLYASATLEVLAGLCILVGFKVHYAAALLALYLIPVTWIFHDFWNLDPLARLIQLIMFLKNLAIFGGLLYVIACGAGKYSCDACRSKK